ncbi:MAG: ABC transporter permease [Planctomycetes bacterium]|nr:ABC transporter permease [Planctomycetota bacterium]
MTGGAGVSGGAGSAPRFARLRIAARRLSGLAVALVVLYLLMTLLSAIEAGGAWYDVSQWRLRPPLFIADAGPDGWSVSGAKHRLILGQCATNLVLGVGMTFVILAADIDLSVGAVLAFANVLFLLAATRWGLGPWIGLPLALAGGVACGLVSGLLTVKGRVPSLISTLGMMLAARGFAFLLSGGGTIYYPSSGFLTTWLPVIVAAFVVAAGAFVLASTHFGRYVYAAGGNREAARLCGVPVTRVRIAVFVIAGACSALAAVIWWARLGAGSDRAGSGYELQAIASVVVGGTSLLGGEGGVIGTLLGALIMGILNRGLDVLLVPTEVQNIIVGAVIVAAVFYDQRRRARAEGGIR